MPVFGRTISRHAHLAPRDTAGRHSATLQPCGWPPQRLLLTADPTLTQRHQRFCCDRSTSRKTRQKPKIPVGLFRKEPTNPTPDCPGPSVRSILIQTKFVHAGVCPPSNFLMQEACIDASIAALTGRRLCRHVQRVRSSPMSLSTGRRQDNTRWRRWEVSQAVHEPSHSVQTTLRAWLKFSQTACAPSRTFLISSFVMMRRDNVLKGYW